VSDVAASSGGRRTFLQGVIRSYDPITGDGTVICDTDLAEYELGRGALEDSIFRMLRQGQRVVFDVDGRGMAVQLRMGSEADMGTPGFPMENADDVQHPQGRDTTT
jgi:cold shock CspA family protein